MKVNIRRPVIAAGASCWTLPAVLQHSQLSFPWAPLLKQAPTEGLWTLDATALVDLDSSTLAFFLACLRVAINRKVTLKIIGVHSKIIALLNVYDIFSLFKGVIDER